MNNSGGDAKYIANIILAGADGWASKLDDESCIEQLFILAKHVKKSSYNEPREWSREATALAYGFVSWYFK